MFARPPGCARQRPGHLRTRYGSRYIGSRGSILAEITDQLRASTLIARHPKPPKVGRVDCGRGCTCTKTGKSEKRANASSRSRGLFYGALYRVVLYRRPRNIEHTIIGIPKSYTLVLFIFAGAVRCNGLLNRATSLGSSSMPCTVWHWTASCCSHRHHHRWRPCPRRLLAVL